jgi:hypothetical protein
MILKAALDMPGRPHGGPLQADTLPGQRRSTLAGVGIDDLAVVGPQDILPEEPWCRRNVLRPEAEEHPSPTAARVRLPLQADDEKGLAVRGC